MVALYVQCTVGVCYYPELGFVRLPKLSVVRGIGRWEVATGRGLKVEGEEDRQFIKWRGHGGFFFRGGG